MIRYRVKWGVALVLLLALRAAAGPVPGVESFDRRPVDFPHPEHLDVWDIGGEQYLVTFRWTPGRPVENPGVVGSFNNWDRRDLPMSDPDADGTWSVTARIGSGRHLYKYVSGADGWHTDPHNPDREPDGYGGDNSVLRLGLDAVIHYLNPTRGDGKMEQRAFEHDPENHVYVDALSSRDVTLRLRTLINDVEGVDLILLNGDDEAARHPMTRAAADDTYEFHEHRVLLNGEVDGALRYTFEVHDGETGRRLDEQWELKPAELEVFETPEWAKSAVWYQIMVDRFRDGDPHNNPEHTAGSSTGRIEITHPWNSAWYTEQPWENDGKGKTFWRWAMYDRLYGGDFEGLIQKLDYLRELGVNAIYLNPVFEAGNSHKYNARTYVFADDGYGVAGEFDKSVARIDLLDSSTWFFNESDKKLLKLIEACHARDMKIILDGVFNHLGDDAISFIDVKQHGKASPFADWYEIESWDPFEYTGWGGFDGLPQFAKDEEKGLASDSLIRHIMDVTSRWMDPNGDGDPSDGIDGWRLDVPFHVPKPFWVAWRKHVKSINPEAIIIGEVWDPAEEWLEGDTFDGVMNYPWAKIAFRWFGNKEQKISASQMDRELARHRMRYPRAATYVLQNLYDSHDTDRWVSRLANPDLPYDHNNRIQDNGPDFMDERPAEVHYKRLMLMAVFQASYVGAPMIWYGTEIGMYGADDPMCRMPMWWEDLGPYDNPDYIIRHDLRRMFAELFALRHEHEALRLGEFATVAALDEQDVYAFARWTPGAERALLTILNNSPEVQRVDLAAPAALANVLPEGVQSTRLLYSPRPTRITAHEGRLRARLDPLTGVVIEIGR